MWSWHNESAFLLNSQCVVYSHFYFRVYILRVDSWYGIIEVWLSKVFKASYIPAGGASVDHEAFRCVPLSRSCCSRHCESVQRQNIAHAVQSAAKQTFNASFRQDLPICTSRRATMRHIKGCSCCMCTTEHLALFFYLLLPPTNYRTVPWTRIAQSHEPWYSQGTVSRWYSQQMSRTPEYRRREEETR